MSKTSLSRRVVVGDVHGHYDGLMHLLEQVALGSDDQLYFLGDLIDRGNQSAQVVEFVRKQGHACIRGNHEQMLLDAFPGHKVAVSALQAWLYNGGHTTYESYGSQVTLLLEHIDWLRTLPLYIDLGEFWLVHAGVDPRLPIAAQTSEEFCWIREEFHGITEPYFPDKTIIVGHTITLTIPGVGPGQLARGQGWIDIDTGAYHPRSGWLTALDLTNSLVYQVNVQDRLSRTLSIDAAAVDIDPERMHSRRQLLSI
ncbi:metallophosphoesterase family protein [Trichothermofontia sp.]